MFTKSENHGTFALNTSQRMPGLVMQLAQQRRPSTMRKVRTR
jgi:hypothetical protein